MKNHDELIQILTKVFEKQIALETKIDSLNHDLQIVKHNSELMKNHINFIEKYISNHAKSY